MHEHTVKKKCANELYELLYITWVNILELVIKALKKVVDSVFNN